jgi:hypothetical protein
MIFASSFVNSVAEFAFGFKISGETQNEYRARIDPVLGLYQSDGFARD